MRWRDTGRSWIGDLELRVLKAVGDTQQGPTEFKDPRELFFSFLRTIEVRGLSVEFEYRGTVVVHREHSAGSLGILRKLSGQWSSIEDLRLNGVVGTSLTSA